MRNINLDENGIGSEGVEPLVKWVEQLNQRCQLEDLSLQGNLIGDDMAVQLAQALSKASPPIRALNLAKNNIGDKGAVALGEFLAGHYHLRTFKVGRNQIRGRGGIALAEALKDNLHIMFFDGSFNQFGVKRNGEFALKMAEAVNKGTLRHLDLSYNSMDKAECERFGQLIHDNHSLWGLHMMGNECLVDSMGFVRTQFKNTVQPRDILHEPVKDGNSLLVNANKPRNAKVFAYQMCWVCEGWSEKRFSWKVGVSGQDHREPAYIHFDFDEYRPWLLAKSDNAFSLWKMVPPGKSYYFYSFGGENGDPETARDQPVIKLPVVAAPKHVREVRVEEVDGETMLPIVYHKSFQLRSVNYVVSTQAMVLDQDYDPVKFQVVVPRMGDARWIRWKVERPRTPWSFPISIFASYQIETEAKIVECFEFDWAQMKFPKMGELEQADVKEELGKAYRIMYTLVKLIWYYSKETYRYLSAIGSNGSAFSMLLNCYTDFVKQIGLLDGKIINQTTSDTEFLAINKRTKASALNPGVALVRFQLIEVLMRLALKRYDESKYYCVCINDNLLAKEASTKADAIRMMYDKNLYPFYGHLHAQKWREERYWNEEVDNVYKSHFPILDKLYKQFGSHYLKPGDKPFMMVDEFENMFVAAGLVNDNFVGRDCYTSFNLAMQTQVDELNRDKHLKAVFVEFLEAFGRACDKMSLPPY